MQELVVMQVLPEYQGRGLGGMLLSLGLERAKYLRKRVFLLSSPEGKHLYAKYGFKAEGNVTMNSDEYGGQGTYVQTAMTRTSNDWGDKLRI
jgi:predicted N-acetyltransferase YhbS